MKKIIALLLVVVMVGAMFVGCTPKTDPKGTTPATDPTNAPATTPTEATPANDEIVTLKWIHHGGGMPENYDAWKANLDAYLEKKIGVHLDVEIIGWDVWDNRRSTIVSTNEPYDILFADMGTFAYDVSIGAFADITDLVKTASPDLYNFIPEDYWAACSINGKIYGVPTYKDSSATQYFVWDKALATKYNPDYASLTNLADLTDTLKAIKDGENISPFILNVDGLSAIYTAKYDALGTGLPALGVSYNDDSATVVPVFEQKDVMDELKIINEWYKAGIINSDAATLAENPAYRACYVAQGWPYAAVSTWGPQMGVEADAIQWGQTVLSNDTVQGSISCISASSEHPDKALELLQLVNTDSYVRDALYYGLEGDNFTYTADGKVEKNEEKEWTMAGYSQATFFNVSMLAGTDYNQWDEVKELNANAKGSPALGFVFDRTNVDTELASCQEIWQRYRSELMTGTVEPEATVAEMMKEMRAAGFDTILNEVQTQLNASLGK